jgi:RES domain-containing protein
MFAEQSHGFPHRFLPLTACTYDVDVADIVDLRTNALRRKSGIDMSDLGCAWKYDHTHGREPASWAIARRLIANGAAGILVPSFAIRAEANMHNLVLWTWGPKPPHHVEVYDPSGRLSKDQLSWHPK